MKNILIEKPKWSRIKQSRVALVGFRATGKTTIGKGLAKALNWNFIDTDERISRAQKLNIEQIVRKHGWNYFRRLESSLLEKVSKKENVVVATGGGIVLSEENRDLLKKYFMSIWLQASPEEIKRRLKTDKDKYIQRPALTDKDLLSEVEEILEERLKYYEEVSCLSISTEKFSIDKSIHHILARLCRKE